MNSKTLANGILRALLMVTCILVVFYFYAKCIFEQYDIQISYNEIFAGWTNETVTRFIAQDIDKGLDVQECEMDIYKNYRGRWSKN